MRADIPLVVIDNVPVSDNVLSSCPLVLADDPNYLANDSRACAGSGISLLTKPSKTVIKPSAPQVR